MNIPDSFPNADIVHLYTHPNTSHVLQDDMYTFHSNPSHIDLGDLTRLCERHFGWDADEILWKFERYVWPAIALRLAVSELNPDWQLDHAGTGRHVSSVSLSTNALH